MLPAPGMSCQRASASHSPAWWPCHCDPPVQDERAELGEGGGTLWVPSMMVPCFCCAPEFFLCVLLCCTTLCNTGVFSFLMPA